ncbi:MAG: NUDIX hydrolase [Patescibacteria group bacterium]
MEKQKAAGCFIEYSNKFLILYRPKTQHQNNEWGLVGGKIDSGESSKQALIRKIREEIGFDASNENLEFLGNFMLQYPDGDWDFFTYRIKLKQPITLQLDPIGCLDYKWVTPEECFSMTNLMQGLYVLLKEIGYIKDGHLS